MCLADGADVHGKRGCPKGPRYVILSLVQDLQLVNNQF